MDKAMAPVPDDWESAYPIDASLDVSGADDDLDSLAKLDELARGETQRVADPAPLTGVTEVRSPAELAARSNKAKEERDAAREAERAARAADPFEALADEIDEGTFLPVKNASDEPTSEPVKGKHGRKRREKKAPLLDRARVGKVRDRDNTVRGASYMMRDFDETNAGIVTNAALTTGQLVYGYVLEATSTIIALVLYRVGWWLKHAGREPVFRENYSQIVLGLKGVARLYGKWLTGIADMLHRTVNRTKEQRKATLERANLDNLDADELRKTISEAGAAAAQSATQAASKVGRKVAEQVERSNISLPFDLTKPDDEKHEATSAADSAAARVAVAGLTEEDKQLLAVADELDPTGKEPELVAAGTPFDYGTTDEEPDDATPVPEPEPHDTKPETATHNEPLPEVEPQPAPAALPDVTDEEPASTTDPLPLGKDDEPEPPVTDDIFRTGVEEPEPTTTSNETEPQAQRPMFRPVRQHTRSTAPTR
ncbi:hypothetical protein [Bifidobacterium vansinderenii]|uniref:Na-Ca exchanger/integrin-beta4 n=1 Tax=Bifidobacterium vansinderenii TaxID=1984871 RepID=A0A229VY02_9BIFI|nr:hypothetical protein [Bifidobacterium vansinderenii]OXN00426.1 Na-Ca exchanger/integrin-beta4 [Bifidobacterium vansinderenii]